MMYRTFKHLIACLLAGAVGGRAGAGQLPGQARPHADRLAMTRHVSLESEQTQSIHSFQDAIGE